MSDEAIASARECIRIARDHRSSDIQKAIKFLKKSISIHKTSEATELLAEYERIYVEENVKPRPQPKSAAPPQPPRRRNSADRKDYTPEQRELAARIKGLKDFYEILGLAKNASAEEIKRAYKKLAMKLHPDKNSAPEAEEAFKKVNAAYQCLTDESKRRNYDEFGDDGSQASRMQQPQSPFGERTDITPEDILNMFFNPHG